MVQQDFFPLRAGLLSTELVVVRLTTTNLLIPCIANLFKFHFSFLVGGCCIRCFYGWKSLVDTTRNV